MPAPRPALLLLLAALLPAGEAKPPGGPAMPGQSLAALAIPAHPVDVILGRPSAEGVTLSLLADADREGEVAFGVRGGALDRRMPLRLRRGEAVELRLAGLAPDTAYAYRLVLPGVESPEGVFRTARPPGSAFVFTITADSHLDENTEPALYARTLRNAAADAPDFHVDLGDTFMTEKHASREDATRQYLAQRWYLGALCRSAPLFLALGNHDGEWPRPRDGEAAARWALGMRRRLFPNPVPDAFYAGDAVERDGAPLQDYFAWDWGDAQCIVLDPYWFSPRQGSDNWQRSLGEAQYRWLAQVLERSRARWRFVFIHQLVGALGGQSRGGSEAAPFFEWGGRNADGSEGFAAHRPGWPEPIHQLLRRHRVSAVFHGHDHLYARQELDGIIYQAVPQPGHPGADGVPRSAAEYGYRQGELHSASGHLRIAVSPQEVAVSLVRSDGGTAHAYALRQPPAGAAP